MVQHGLCHNARELLLQVRRQSHFRIYPGRGLLAPLPPPCHELRLYMYPYLRVRSSVSLGQCHILVTALIEVVAAGPRVGQDCRELAVAVDDDDAIRTRASTRVDLAAGKDWELIPRAVRGKSEVSGHHDERKVRCAAERVLTHSPTVEINFWICAGRRVCLT